MCNLSDPKFHDADKAREHLESIRWPNGPFCPHCGEAEQIGQLKGKSHRPGLYKCYSCKGHFSVTVGTVFEKSKVPLNKWLLAAHLLAASKKGISAHQIHRELGVTYKTAWFMMHRLREAARDTDTTPLGSGGGIVEVDETFWGRKRGQKKRQGYAHKEAIVTLINRGGKARSFHVPNVTMGTLRPILWEQISVDARVMTDKAGQYRKLKGRFNHESVDHSINEYVRGDVSTNACENYFSVLKRGLFGTYQHVSGEHLKRYIGEFDFRYNYRSSLGYSDSERATELLKGIEGKRLTYRRPIAG